MLTFDSFSNHYTIIPFGHVSSTQYKKAFSKEMLKIVYLQTHF